MAILLVAFPCLLFMLPIWIRRGESDWSEFVLLFNPKEWRDCFGTIAECFLGARWFVTGAQRIDESKLLPYSYYDSEDHLVCCLFLEDAVVMNMSFGGTLMDRKTLRKRNKLRN